MTLHRLQQLANELERMLAELRRLIEASQPHTSAADTFGMFADDEGFDEMVRLGREYRKQANSEDVESFPRSN